MSDREKVAEHLGFVKQSYTGLYMAARRAYNAGKAAPKAPKGFGIKGKLLGAGALVGAGAVAGGIGVAKVNKQPPMEPGSMEREKRRHMADRFGNY